MTEISDLTNEDLAQLRTLRKVFLLQHVLFLLLAVILSLLLGLFSIRDFGYLTGVGVTFAFLIVVYFIFFAQQYFEYWKDNKHQKKICANIVVVKKLAKGEIVTS